MMTNKRIIILILILCVASQINCADTNYNMRKIDDETAARLLFSLRSSSANPSFSAAASSSSSSSSSDGSDGGGSSSSSVKKIVATNTTAAILTTSTNHNINGKFICDVCGKGYSDNSGLKRHQKNHADEKPYACHYNNCNKRFARQDLLTRHEHKTHEQEKEYKCRHCRLSFGYKHVLKKHIKIRHTANKENNE